MLGKHRIPALLNDDVIACRRKYADSHVTSSCAASMSEKLAELLTTEFSTNVCERPAWRYWRLNDPLCSELCSERCGDRCAKIANAFEWLGQPQKNAPSTWGSATHLTHGSFGPLESSSTTACRSVWPFCTAHCRMSYCFTLRYVFPKTAPSPWWMRSPSNTWYYVPPESLSQTASRSVQPFLYESQMLCCIQCIVNEKKNPKNALCLSISSPRRMKTEPRR